MARSGNGAVTPIDAGSHRDRVLARRNRLIEEHLDLVPAIARRIHQSLPPSFELDDLVAQGNIGLVKAATVYRPHKHGGCPFSAFARHRIRGAILDSVRRRHYIEATRPSLEDQVPVSPLAASDTIPSRLEEILADDTDLERDLDRAELFKRLEAAIARLSDEQRELLAAYYDEEVRTARDIMGRWIAQAKIVHWRRQKRVAEMHDSIIELLRREIAS